MRSRTIIATPPGATIKEQLVDRRMSQKEFASRMDMSEKHISKLINGDVQLTPDMAMRLEMVLGLPAHFWSNLETRYREKIQQVQNENSMDADLETIKKIPYNEMAKNGWVEETRISSQRVINLRKYFEVVQLELLNKPQISRIACRKLGDGVKSDYTLLAWAQKAKLEARSIKTAPINIEKLTALLPSIRKMTMQNPANFCPELCSKLADCGIALVFLPHIGGSFLHGATFLDGTKIVIGMTVRGKDADRFWFSLFHEFAHIILGHISKEEGTTDADEAAADVFARNTLIPDNKFKSFTDNEGYTDKAAVIGFARSIDIDVGIVVGRLQKEKFIPFNWFSDLKTRYELNT